MTEIPSIKRANKAGDRLRYDGEGRDQPGVDMDEERAVLAAWRSQFQTPMSATAMTLRSAFCTVTGYQRAGDRVNERFKREQQIVAKLIRSKTRLSKMEDIGGCRAVMDNLHEVHALRDRISSHARSVTIASEDDYTDAPRQGGYRALHLHVVRNEVQIEVQLRTVRQHRWAETVERWDAASGHDIKHESGPEDVIEAFRYSADMFADLDQGLGGTIYAQLKKEQAAELLTRWLEDRRRRRDF